MTTLYSPSAHGFYFQDDKNAPADSFQVSDADHITAVNLPEGSTYSFSAPVAPATTGTLTTVAPSLAYLLAQAQSIQIGLIQAAYTSAINMPTTFKNAAGVTSTYPAGLTVSINSQTAIQNLSNIINAGSAAWTLGKWLDTNNIAQTFTYADLQGLAAAMESVEVADWVDLIGKVAQVQAATTVADVQAVTF